MGLESTGYNSFTDDYFDVVEKSKELVVNTGNAIVDNTDLSVILLTGFLSSVLIIGMFWIGFLKSAALIVQLDDRINPNPVDYRNIGVLFIYPVFFTITGLILYVLSINFINLVWEVDFQERLKLFMGFNYLDYEPIIEDFGTSKQFGKFMIVLIDMFSGFVIFMLIFTPTLIFVMSFVFSFAILGRVSSNPTTSQNGSIKIPLLIVITVIVNIIIYVMYTGIIDTVFFEETITRNGKSFGSVQEMIQVYIKEGTVNGIKGIVTE